MKTIRQPHLTFRKNTPSCFRRNRATQLLPLLIATASVVASPTWTPSARAQNSRVRARQRTPKRSPDKLTVLRGRLDKARIEYSKAFLRSNEYEVFRVRGEVIPNANTEGLCLFGQAEGLTASAGSSQGWARSNAALVVFNYDSGALYEQNYDGICVYRGQFRVGAAVCPGYVPAPMAYFDAVVAMDKYQKIAASIEAEISTLVATRRQQQQKLAQARYARLDAVDKVRRDSVHRSRVALQQKEAKALLASINEKLAKQPSNTGLLIQSKDQLIALFDKWGMLGVPDRTLYNRTVQVLLQGATVEARSGRLLSSAVLAREMLSLQIFGSNRADESSERQLFSMSSDWSEHFPDVRSLLVLRSGQTGLVTVESAEVQALAEAWFTQLPIYLNNQPAPPQNEAVGIVMLSQVMAQRLFKTDAARLRVLGKSILRAQELYGAEKVKVFPVFQGEVNLARSVS